MKQIIKISLAMVSTLVMTTQNAVSEVLTEVELHATLGIVTNFILDDTVMHHGKTYKPVVSPHTGRVWLDRNIGANQKCTSLDDTQCYGDYFQWGRTIDGHQNSIDSTTVLATDINNAGAEFVRGAFDWTIMDFNYGNERTTNWLKIDGSSVCPVGYRVPVKGELDAEVGDITNKETAYANFLKFPAAGYRDYVSANYEDRGTWGTVWSVSSTLSKASYFRFWSASDWKIEGERAWGLSVRCIKHVEKPIYHNYIYYNTVTSPHTGKIWLDRNLGAARVCVTFNDATCYGNYFQWGRQFDGHQSPTSTTTSVYAMDINSAGNKFIQHVDWTLDDTTGILRSTIWSNAGGNSVCPLGFRVPSLLELQAETTDNGVGNRNDAFNTFLKLPATGGRNPLNNNMFSVGSSCYVWTSSVAGTLSNIIKFDIGSTSWISSTRGYGYPVRCIKN